MSTYVRELRNGDWPNLWPLLQAMGTPNDDAETGRTFIALAADPRWAAMHVRYLEWRAHETTASPFYERLGYHGEPCPQPDYPYSEVTFERASHG